MSTLARTLAAAAAVLALAYALAGFAQDKAMQEIQKYRDMLQEGNPAELLELEGEALWITPRGPNNATLEQCDLGLGPGRLEGAYAHLPRWFADTRSVQDVESRLVTCMTALQGMSRADATAGWYQRESDIEALVTFVASKSKGHKIEVPARHPQEAQMYAIGEEIFFRRSGPLDFACATCHSQDDKRIRLQELPNLTTVKGAQTSMAQWPAYRVSQSAVWTLERRLIDCMRQMRFPDADFLSDAVIALQVYMQKNASGATLEAPGIKR
jgi:L-cysteine S-thiosulfotransferase